MSNKSLVLFYSWFGNTLRIARIIAEKTEADLQELQPETPYPELQHSAFPGKAGDSNEAVSFSAAY